MPDPVSVTGPFVVKDYSNDEKWLAARNFGLGASDVPVVLGLSPWKSPFALFTEKLGIKPDHEELERLAWGNLLETPIADRYAKVTRRTLEDWGRRTILVSTQWPFLCCTLDRVCVSDERGPGVVEVKNASEFTSDEWVTEPPLMYQVQVQAQCAVTGFAWGAVVALIGGNRLVHFDVERNDHFISGMVEKCREFHEAVQRREPPEIDASSATADALARLFPEETAGTTRELPEDAIEWDARRQEAAEQIKKWEGVKEEMSSRLKAAIGDAAVGVIRGVASYSWKVVKRKEYIVKASQFRTLRRSA